MKDKLISAAEAKNRLRKDSVGALSNTRIVFLDDAIAIIDALAKEKK